MEIDLKKIVPKRIKEISFQINEALVTTTPLFKSEIALQFAFNLDTNIVDIGIRVFYRYENSTDELAFIIVQNVYEVPNLKQYEDDGKLSLPQIVLVNLIGMSISHTRALFAARLAGTKLNDGILAIAPADEVARHFFPYIFENQDTSKNPVVKKSGKSKVTN